MLMTPKSLLFSLESNPETLGTLQNIAEVKGDEQDDVDGKQSIY